MVIALCCPVYGCDQIYYIAGRDSEMKGHLTGHERRNELVQRKAAVIMPRI